MRPDAPLPIDSVLPDLQRALEQSTSAVLVAPPGAGKTTRVPLALLDAPWRQGGKILVLEPRRLAARNAAERMATTLGEAVGGRIGIRARLASKVGPATRVEVVTEGVFTRMILDDPELKGVGAVLFDEFHERSLDADLGLALARDAQDALRPDLRILVMSATLEAVRVATLLGGAPLIESEGRAYPVETRYLGRDPARRLEDQVADAIERALRAEKGSLLAFLPGQGEIRRVVERLEERSLGGDVLLAPLYGAMDAAAQDAAIEPAPAGTRKVVLATSIAETSLTIEGVRVVVDAGLARVPRYEPGIGMSRLETVKASRASVDQRRGRAGRTEPGVCYRLWDEPQTQSLPAFADPEIRAADLTGLVLDCAEWGATDPATLAFLDAPPKAALSAARDELAALGAIDSGGRITEQGRRLRQLPLPPRIARMLLAAERIGGRDAVRLAAEIAALLVERGLGGNDRDLAHRLDAFRRDRSRRGSDMRRMAEGWARQAMPTRAQTLPDASGADRPAAGLAELLAAAYPDRIAKARGAPGQFLLANGRAASVEAVDALARAPFLVVAEMQGKAAEARILLAARASEEEIAAIAGGRIRTLDEIAYDEQAGAVRARRLRRLGAITLAAEPRAVEAGSDVACALAEGAARAGVGTLPWSRAQAQLRDRIAFLRAAEGGAWPDLSDAALALSPAIWLAPFLVGKTKAAEINAGDLGNALEALIPYDLKRRLEAAAPTHFEAPTGNRHAIDYDGAGAPRLAIRVQELFGLKEHPAIAGGRLPLTLELLSPAHRPIQVTRDLPGFWKGSWADVKSQMRGRYPRHPWPDDPASAAPTARAKPRGT
ncbi:MAG: ATP-dependent helicase HrpB [Hyphomicrobiaceae bacterium]|nr:ATP-dependent helicase HrpB [Hyphomicrobiaceae bacterium]